MVRQMGEKHSRGTNLDLDEIKDLLSGIKDNILETQKIADKGVNIKSNSKEIHTTNQEVETLLKNLRNIRKSNTLQKYFTDAETAQGNLAKAYDNYLNKINSGNEKQIKQATADVARYANAFSALGGNPDVIDKKIKKITAQYMKTNNPSTGWLYGVENFKEAFTIMQKIENLAPGTFFKNLSSEATKASDAVVKSVKKANNTIQSDSLAKNIFDSDEGEREANKLVETMERIWAKVAVGNKELSSGDAIDFVSAFHELNYYLEQTPRKMEDARAALVDFKNFFLDIYDFLPSEQRGELTDFMMTPKGQVDSKAMLGVAIEYWQDMAKSIDQASDAQKNFYSNQFVEIQNLTESQKQYRIIVGWLQEYYDLLQKIKTGNRGIVTQTGDDLPLLVNGSDTRKGKDGNYHATQAKLKRLLSDYDSLVSKKGVSEKSKNAAIDEIAAYTNALDKTVDAEKLFGEKHAELFSEVALRIRNAEEATDAYNKSLQLMKTISLGATSMGASIVSAKDFKELEKVLSSGGIEGALKYLVETMGMELPEATKKASEAADEEASAEKKAGEAARSSSEEDIKAVEAKKQKIQAKKESAKASEDEAAAELEAAEKEADAAKQREYNAKRAAQYLADASERVYKSESHNANGTTTAVDYIDHFRTRTTKTGYDKSGDYYVLESTKENYVELEKQIQRNDKAITQLTKDMYLNARAGADTSAWQNRIDALEEYNKALLEIRNNGWVGTDEYLPEQFHADVFDSERLKAQEKDWEGVISAAQKRLKGFISDTEKISAKPLMNDLSAQVSELHDSLIVLSGTPIDFKNSNIDVVRQQVVEFLNTLRGLEIQLNTVRNQSSQDDFIPANIKDVQNLDNNIMTFLDNNTAASKQAREALESIHRELRQIVETGEQVSKIRLDELAARASEVEAEVRRLHQTGNSFFRTFTKQLKSANAQFLATYFSFQDMIRYAREVITTVTQINSALTELRKVSDASTERLAQNFEVSAKTAKELGSSITHVINITADWARLNKLGLFV